MKKMVITGIMIFAVTAGYAYAQMGGGMMGGQQGKTGQGGTMMQGTEGMMQMMHRMTGIMQKISDMMGRGKGSENIEMSEMMRDMSRQMMKMSNTMQSGNASREDMKTLRQGIPDIH